MPSENRRCPSCGQTLQRFLEWACGAKVSLFSTQQSWIGWILWFFKHLIFHFSLYCFVAWVGILHIWKSVIIRGMSWRESFIMKCTWVGWCYSGEMTLYAKPGSGTTQRSHSWCGQGQMVVVSLPGLVGSILSWWVAAAGSCLGEVCSSSKAPILEKNYFFFWKLLMNFLCLHKAGKL